MTLTSGEELSLSLSAVKGTNNPGSFLGINSISASGQIIPEPATATLSLLVLAGLAMRRRRR